MTSPREEELEAEVSQLASALRIRELQRDQALIQIENLRPDIARHKDMDRVIAEEREACAALVSIAREHARIDCAPLRVLDLLFQIESAILARKP